MPVALAALVPSLARRHHIPLTTTAQGVALTFDDGPHAAGTVAVLDLLESAGARATFFLAGEQAERLPTLAAEIVLRGHLVGLHCHRHRPMPLLSAVAVDEDLRRGAAAIEDACGVSPGLHRPPYGAYSNAGLAAVRARGFAPLLWSRWGRDWRRWTTPARIVARATRDLERGDVILLHDADHYSSRDSWRRTVAALPGILDAIGAGGLQPVQPTGSGSGSADASLSQPR